MRELKFRAWDSERKEYFTSPKWVEFSINKDGVLTAKNYNYSGKVQQLTVEQFTGLTDKNSVEIYEGDIVSGVIYKDGSLHNGFVLFDYNGYRIKTSSKSLELDLTEKLTVIGNIHQNQELLK